MNTALAVSLAVVAALWPTAARYRREHLRALGSGIGNRIHNRYTPRRGR